MCKCVFNYETTNDALNFNKTSISINRSLIYLIKTKTSYLIISIKNRKPGHIL